MIFLTKLIIQFPLDGFLFSFPNLSLDDFQFPLRIFFQPPRPSFIRRAPPLSPALPPQEEGETAPSRRSEPLRSKVGGASEPSPLLFYATELRLFVRCKPP